MHLGRHATDQSQLTNSSLTSNKPTLETETLNVSSGSKINWFPYGPDYLAGYLPGEGGYDYNYSIHEKWKRGSKVYRLFGPKFNHLIDCPNLENAQAFSERIEANK